MAVGTLLFAFALTLRFALEDAPDTLPFVTFLLAVVGTASVASWAISATVALASGIAAWFWFLPPAESFALVSPWGPLAVAMFALISVLVIGLSELLADAVLSVAREQARAAALAQSQADLVLELQHRVANSMQFSASLMSLQAAQVNTVEEAREALRDAVSRLSAAARIHRRLYDPELGRRPAGSLIDELVRDLLRSAGRDDVAVTVDIAPAVLGLARLTALAMLAAEATLNAIKHGFADRVGGALEVTLRAVDGGWLLRIADDGPGPPEGVDLSETPSLGMRVMQSMARQLGGTVRFGQAAQGMAVEVAFPA
jgi:two-component sensor histidine kinase